MNNHIFDSLRDQIMATLDGGGAEWKSRPDAAPIEQTIDGWYCLLRDGAVVHSETTAAGTQVVASTPQQAAALVGALITRFPIATWFLPARGAAEKCSHCAGTGSVIGLPEDLRRQVVCECGGIGWKPMK
jgi:hypothetical protein